jgi:hypothetical protein
MTRFVRFAVPAALAIVGGALLGGLVAEFVKQFN